MSAVEPRVATAPQPVPADQPPTDLGERHHVRQPDHFRDPPADAVVQNVDREREVDIDEGVLLPQFQIVRVPTPQTLKSGLQPMIAPVAKFGVAPAAVRNGLTGDEQKMFVALAL